MRSASCLAVGPPRQRDQCANVRYEKRRRYPVFGIALNGVNGYRLQVAPGQAGDRTAKGQRRRGQGAVSAGAAASGYDSRCGSSKPAIPSGLSAARFGWTARPPPAQPTITHKETKEPRNGKPSIWGSPYSGTPIRYDDIVVKKTTK